MTTGSGSWIRQEKRLAIYLRDRFACVYCERDLSQASPRDLTLDHLTPRSSGGSNDPSNLITACHPCNSKRRALGWIAFIVVNFPESHHKVERSIQNAKRRKLNMDLAKAIQQGRLEGSTVEEADTYVATVA